MSNHRFLLRLLFGSYHPGWGPASRMMNFWWTILGLKSIMESTAPRRNLTKGVRLVSRETTAAGRPRAPAHPAPSSAGAGRTETAGRSRAPVRGTPVFSDPGGRQG